MLFCHYFSDGSVYVPEVVYTLLPIDYVHDSQSLSNQQASLYVLYCFFLSAMPRKNLAPFCYIYRTPQKTLF